ncbi:hypothetical protein VTN31DRAFT_1934 [Thermomyces dupontii]|uniref:uncharacterized protein n=1 Tax=Talaromyces thermophilus TaxID=28565 RepID=UPI003742F83A
MFSKHHTRGRSDSFNARYRAGKSTSRSMKRSFQEHLGDSRRTERETRPEGVPNARTLTSPVITICVGPEKRLFAAHEEILCMSPVFADACRGQFFESPNTHSKTISLPEEQPEVFSCVLEYLYKGDYYPRLLHNRRRNTWELENEASDMDVDGTEKDDATIVDQATGNVILKDTAVYCAAERYNLSALKRLALRKQGLQSGIQCSTILASARYAYAHTPDTDSKLRAHYLALIIRCRSTFKRSGTMQMEMEQGGKLFFDLFVAMCNYIDDLADTCKSPRSA